MPERDCCRRLKRDGLRGLNGSTPTRLFQVKADRRRADNLGKLPGAVRCSEPSGALLPFEGFVCGGLSLRIRIHSNG